MCRLRPCSAPACSHSPLPNPRASFSWLFYTERWIIILLSPGGLVTGRAVWKRAATLGEQVSGLAPSGLIVSLNAVICEGPTMADTAHVRASLSVLYVIELLQLNRVT